MSEQLLPSRQSLMHLRHGHTVGEKYTPTYHSWQAMLARTRYPHRDTKGKHVGRGITVCERWLSFDSFLADMGERPVGSTLDRYPNNNGNYEPSNCRWASHTEQARNRRNNRLDFNQAVCVAVLRLSGETCRSIAEKFGISESLPREIVKGRTWPDALLEAQRVIQERENG